LDAEHTKQNLRALEKQELCGIIAAQLLFVYAGLRKLADFRFLYIIFSPAG
jgi:hypothetical protein